MRVNPYRISLVLFLAIISISVEASAQAPRTTVMAPSGFSTDVAPMMSKYCATCHDASKAKGGFNLALYATEAAVTKDLKTWQKVLDHIEGGSMPPDDHPQPSEAEVKKVVGFLQSTLSKSNCSIVQDPGRVTLRRLNKEEYNNTVRDLIGVDFRPADDFPSDDVGYGFDNIGDVLTLPPLLMEKYLTAAESIANQAILGDDSPQGPTKRTKATAMFRKDSGGHESGETGDYLMHTNAEVFTDPFAKGGNYMIRARAFGQRAGDALPKMEFRVDGKLLKAFDVKAEENSPEVHEARVRLKHGGRFSVAFVNDAYFSENPDPKRRDRNLAIDYVEVVGPMYSLPNDLPDSHRRILFRRPGPSNHREVAREILTKFATRAFRRPATTAEVDRLIALVDLAEMSGDRFEKGIQLAVQAVLVSPHFLFRVELETRPGAPRSLTDLELASRLSYFLWSSMPDDELLDLATKNQLRVGKNLDLQVSRMLKDSKTREFVENFSGQWLQTRNLKQVNPDRGEFATFDEPLRLAMQREVELFFNAIVHEDRPIAEFLHAEYTFLNERLAKHYGIAGVKGDQFRRVALTDKRRGGVVTMASVLTVTSNPNRTSPVKRGKWILEEILGTPPPPPPPGVGDLTEEKKGSETASLRVRLEKHRSNAACASCHARMDPLGFGLENFDAIGAYRDKASNFPVDATGTLPGGQSFNGPVELKAVLLTKIKPFSRCLTEKMMTYALGRGLEYPDRCVVDKLSESLVKDGGQFSKLISGIVHSDPFQKRGVEGSVAR